jgi:hypothetical protein
VRSLARPSDLAGARRRIASLDPRDRPRWGRMTVGQMVCHAADACRMALGECPSARRPGALAPVQRVVALWIPLPWPRGITTTPELDQHVGGTSPSTFAADVEALQALVARVATAADLEARTHPVFGAMSQCSWLRWAYLHLDHHLRQFGR